MAKLKRMKNILVMKTGEALVGPVLDKEIPKSEIHTAVFLDTISG